MQQGGPAAGMADHEYRLPDLLAPEAREEQVIQHETAGVEYRGERHQHQQPEQHSTPSGPGAQRPYMLENAPVIIEIKVHAPILSVAMSRASTARFRLIHFRSTTTWAQMSIYLNCAGSGCGA